MRKNTLNLLLVAGLVVVLIGVSVAAAPGNSGNTPAQSQKAQAQDQVGWDLGGFIELSVNSDFDFGTIEAGQDKVTEENAANLVVKSNTKWSLSFQKSGAGSSHLKVLLNSNQGEDDQTLSVGYKLTDLRNMDPGTYNVTITYTATTK